MFLAANAASGTQHFRLFICRWFSQEVLDGGAGEGHATDMLHISAGRNGGWSPALTINKVCLSLMSMLASATELVRPHCWRLLRCLFVVHGLHVKCDFCGKSGSDLR